jgi:hypothetical protein
MCQHNQGSSNQISEIVLKYSTCPGRYGGRLVLSESQEGVQGHERSGGGL